MSKLTSLMKEAKVDRIIVDLTNNQLDITYVFKDDSNYNNPWSLKEFVAETNTHNRFSRIEELLKQ